MNFDSLNFLNVGIHQCHLTGGEVFALVVTVEQNYCFGFLDRELEGNSLRLRNYTEESFVEIPWTFGVLLRSDFQSLGPGKNYKSNFSFFLSKFETLG